LIDEFSKNEKIMAVESVNILPSIISPTEEAPTITAEEKTFLISFSME
jgi:hypothetical protein